MSESKVPLPEPDAVSGHNDNYGEKCWTRKLVKKYGDARAAERDAEVERLVEALREARPYCPTTPRNMAGQYIATGDKIDALLREYTPKEKQDD